MGKTKVWHPREPYRPRWGMYHKPDNWYDRGTEKKPVEEVSEEDDNINWCPVCGVGSEIMGDEICEKCMRKLMGD